ncbi:hypothetical protein [Pseudoalteromonas ulvae]|uniref:Major tail protein n=1 Tax=Pseudoalteromonas ulvae TaxID=107327 RepID=A0A244CUZ8_PSEDV|nr:hypothetical protein [Pseudoalteromonas ulvae]OUL59266.1 hypothetical protein B1199_03075 [Pseudoalteromonas ulvae]
MSITGSGFVLRGEVFLQRVNSKGVAISGANLVGPINASEFSITPDSEEILRPSVDRSTYGESKGRVTTKKPTKVKLKFDDVTSQVLAEALGAELSTLNYGAATGTDAAYTLESVASGGWTEIGHNQLKETGFVVKKGVDVMVLGTDYEVKWSSGLIRPVAGGALDAGGAVTITFEALAGDGHRLAGGEIQEVNWRIKLDGVNADTGEKVLAEVPLAQVSSTSEINLLQNEYLAPEFEGVCSIAQGKSKAYTMDILA